MEQIKRFIPLNNVVLARQLSGDNITPGGLFIPDSAITKKAKAKVLRISDAYKNKQEKDGRIWLREDAVVSFVQGAEAPIIVDGEELVYFKVEHILSVD